MFQTFTDARISFFIFSFIQTKEKKGCITWRSYRWDIPQGDLNTLPTFDNLKRWGKIRTNKCPICGNFGNIDCR